MHLTKKQIQNEIVIKVDKQFYEIVFELIEKLGFDSIHAFNSYYNQFLTNNEIRGLYSARSRKSITPPPVLTIRKFEGLLDQYLINKYVMLRVSMNESSDPIEADKEYQLILDMELSERWKLEYRALKRAAREEMHKRMYADWLTDDKFWQKNVTEFLANIGQYEMVRKRRRLNEFNN